MLIYNVKEEKKIWANNNLTKSECMNMAVLTNTELFRLFVEKGSKEAINTFFQNQNDLFYRVAYKYTKNAADAEDVLQSAFLNIMNTAYQYKGLQMNEERLLQSWCLSVVVHCSLMKIRTDSNRRNRETNYSITNNKTFYEENAMEKKLENEAIHKKVQNAIIQLPEKYRIPIHLKYVEGFELEAIAKILKLNANTLRSLIKRGLEKVSTQLKEENVTLSNVGLVGLIEGMPVEKAPFAYQPMGSKILESEVSSRRISVSSTPKTSIFTAKIILSITVAFIGVIGYMYFGNTMDSNNGDSAITNSQTRITNSTGLLPKFTNQTWDFSKESDRHLAILRGKWEWSKALQGMASDTNSMVLISLPIVPQDKAFMIEFDMVVEQKEMTVTLNAYWVRNNSLVAHDCSIKKNKFDVYPSAIEKSFKFYYYKGYMCYFFGEECYQINKYSQNLEGANLSIAARNFIIKKITCQTFDVPPEKLHQAIKNLPTDKPVTQEEVLVELMKNE